MKKFFLTICFMIFVGAGAIGAYVFHFVTVPAGTSAQTQVFDLPPGTSFHAVAVQLEAEGLIRNARVFGIYARILGLTTQVRVGEYELNAAMTPRQILDVLASGKSIEKSFTIPEGYNIFEIAQVLDRVWPGRAAEFVRLTNDKTLIKALLGRDAVNLEGYLFPETYSATKYTTTEALVRMMVKRFMTVYENIKSDQNRVQMPMHDAVTFASIVEKETGVPEERPLIASVFQNRLMKHMRIQSDPTIIYGQWIKTGEYLTNIQRRHILEPTDYNTYTISALPIGPISNPGESALRATLNPATSEYLFFVSRNDGTHVFSRTLAEHNKAVRDFQLNSKAREGKSWRKK